MRMYLLRPWAVGLSFVAVLIFSFPLSALSAAAANDPTTGIKHKPMDYFVPGHRIQVSADISDGNGVRLARCYFKASEEADYIFVVLQDSGKGAYAGIMPAPGEDTKLIEYLFLVVNESNVVVKSQAFKMKRSDDDDVPAWQQKSAEGEVNVYSELAQAPEQPPGFTDAIHQDLVESSLRFGVVAGIYPATTVASGSATGEAAAATNAGTVTASSGMSGLAIAAITGGVLVAVGAGAALAINESESDDESDSGGGGASLSSDITDYEGTYTYTISSYTYSTPGATPPSGGSFELRVSSSNSPSGQIYFTKSGRCKNFSSPSSFNGKQIVFSNQYKEWFCEFTSGGYKYTEECCSNNMSVTLVFSSMNSGEISFTSQSCCDSQSITASGDFTR